METANDGSPASDQRNTADAQDAPASVRMKRPPMRQTAPNHVFVSGGQRPVVIFKIIRRLLDSKGHDEVFIHGMGASITKAVHVSQDILLHYGDELALETSIGTVFVIDEIIGDYENTSEERRVSSLTLRLYRETIAGSKMSPRTGKSNASGGTDSSTVLGSSGTAAASTSTATAATTTTTTTATAAASGSSIISDLKLRRKAAGKGAGKGGQTNRGTSK
eukprot:TRINITY_DN6363_c6_g1_i1.p1 TRINITY_DN6363_c6_g1~~TRINITY_DN6363_c6_g1_i1.p1  ORF type:complete len:220 (+),score=40.89 TRINITY_DN6363_c6_g1_i1:55-714(+)